MCIINVSNECVEFIEQFTLLKNKLEGKWSRMYLCMFKYLDTHQLNRAVLNRSV